MPRAEPQSSMLDRQFQALANPARRKILLRLDDGPATLGQLEELCGFAMPTVLQHVRVLEDAALVATRKIGRQRVCALTQQRPKATQWLEEHTRLWQRSLKRLARSFEEAKP